MLRPILPPTSWFKRLITSLPDQAARFLAPLTRILGPLTRIGQEIARVGQQTARTKSQITKLWRQFG